MLTIYAIKVGLVVQMKGSNWSILNELIHFSRQEEWNQNKINKILMLSPMVSNLIFPLVKKIEKKTIMSVDMSDNDVIWLKQYDLKYLFEHV